MPPDLAPPMDTRASSSAFPGVGDITTSLGIPAVNPLGGSLGSIPTFVGNSQPRSHKKRNSSEKSKKHQKKSKHVKKSDDGHVRPKPRVSVLKSTGLSSSSSTSS